MKKQRWLVEHNAFPSLEGWRRPLTSELVKCQKDLLIDMTTQIRINYIPNMLIIDNKTDLCIFNFHYITKIDNIDIDKVKVELLDNDEGNVIESINAYKKNTIEVKINFKKNLTAKIKFGITYDDIKSNEVEVITIRR